MRMGTQVALPGQAAELTSVGQLDPAEEAAVRLRRARRVMNRPQELAGLDPAEQLEECLRVLRAAEARRDGTVRDTQLRAAAVFFDTAGPYLVWVRENGLYCLDDPSRTFERWLSELWGYSQSQCYLFIDAVRVRAALGLAGSEEYAYRGTVVTTGHIKALAPAVNARLGPEGVQQLWADTEARDGKATETGLRRTWRAYRELAAAQPTDGEGEAGGAGTGETSENSEDAGRVARWGVNEELRAVRAALETLQARYGRLTNGGLAPLDAAAATREAAQVRALGRWFSRHAAVPEDVVLDAEIVQD
ncbi:hypothetical protein [Kitasatospora sp. NPDC006786]|uniref:hypothetical protein n=1 Tax=unclassified Kitasatospora TaxID=2633591 RepID=UPI0033C77C5E